MFRIDSLLQYGQQILATILLVLHALIWIVDEPLLKFSLTFVLYGLFLLWQPLWNKQEKMRRAPVVMAALVSVLLAYFPFCKLIHMAGVFLSPTRNLANSNRRVRHINPWDYPVKVHTYEEYEDELRDKMKAAGIPVEKA